VGYGGAHPEPESHDARNDGGTESLRGERDSAGARARRAPVLTPRHTGDVPAARARAAAAPAGVTATVPCSATGARTATSSCLRARHEDHVRGCVKPGRAL
jgi:hypothetical protein